MQTRGERKRQGKGKEGNSRERKGREGKRRKKTTTTKKSAQVVDRIPPSSVLKQGFYPKRNKHWWSQVHFSRDPQQEILLRPDTPGYGCPWLPFLLPVADKSHIYILFEEKHKCARAAGGSKIWRFPIAYPRKVKPSSALAMHIIPGDVQETCRCGT